MITKPRAAGLIQALRERFRYNPITGKIGRVSDLRKRIGQTAGISWEENGESRFDHLRTTHIVWMIHHGVYPTGQIRFRNGLKTDYRIDNLYEFSSLKEAEKAILENPGIGFVRPILHVDVEELKKCFDCDPETGRVWRKAYINTRQRPPGFSGTKSGNYLVLPFGKRNLPAHRIMWALIHGYWPPLIVDHINGDTFDNRLINLREASNTQNLRNRKLSKGNKSGVTGVTLIKGKWVAGITVNRKVIRLGSFDTRSDATQARQAAEVKYFGEFARTA